MDSNQVNPNQMDPNHMVVTMDASWTAESYFDSNSNSLNLASLEAAMTATYNYSMTPMPSASQTSPDDCMPTPIFDTDDFPQHTPRSRYTSLDYDRPDMGFILPLERRHSLTNDAKESAKERRRTQNRFAQRAYRQRKEQAIKDQEKEIEDLKLQLAKEKKLNQALAKVIDFLKERLKGKPLVDLPATPA